MKIGVVDYEAGNLKSVETALRYLKSDFIISDKPEVLGECGKIVFPGVGEASSAMGILKEKRLDQFLQNAFNNNLPILGICLGCQIVLDSSEENEAVCLGIVPGRSVKFPDGAGLKVPHMGWNQVKIQKDHYIFEGIKENSSFYFVHSYYPELINKENSIGMTEYGLEFTSAFSLRNLTAVQFHPEKSGEAGLRLLKNFIENG